jgi:hypothetical protein
LTRSLFVVVVSSVCTWMQQVRVGSVWVELSEKSTGKCEPTML